MRKKNLIASICALAMVTLTGVPVMADATKVVSIGANLTQEQKDTMLRYFAVQKDPSVQRINVTNKDEVEHLADFVPIEQIGTRTVSCAYIKPTESGGIRVKTANLEYVTANMIASTLADLGIKNCEVVAACPFKVSGTGALTGIMMAYETATGEKLDETKKDIATQEMVIIKDLSEEIGAEKAETVINQAKAEAVQNNIADKQEIENTINNIITENNITITNEQIQNITNLTQNIVSQDYDDEYVDTIKDIMSEEPEVSDEPLFDEDSITAELDEGILGEDVIVSATDQADLGVIEGETVEEPVEESQEEAPAEGPLEEVPLEEPEEEESKSEDESAENEIPEVSKYGFNMKDVVDKEGKYAAKEFLAIEKYMVKHFPAEWTETELMTKDIKPEEKMSDIAEEIMNPYYEYLMKEESEREQPLFDTFMDAVSKLMEEGKISEAEGIELHEIAPVEEDILAAEEAEAELNLEGGESYEE